MHFKRYVCEAKRRTPPVIDYLFHRDKTRQEAEATLKDKPPGTYMVRGKTGTEDQLVISTIHEEGFWHGVIEVLLPLFLCFLFWVCFSSVGMRVAHTHTHTHTHTHSRWTWPNRVTCSWDLTFLTPTLKSCLRTIRRTHIQSQRGNFGISAVSVAFPSGSSKCRCTSITCSNRPTS